MIGAHSEFSFRIRADLRTKPGRSLAPGGPAIFALPYGVDEAAVLQGRRHGNDVRLAALCLCRRLTAERVASLAARFGGVSSSAITKAVTRSQNRRSIDPNWDRHVSQLEALIRSQQNEIERSRL